MTSTTAWLAKKAGRFAESRHGIRLVGGVLFVIGALMAWPMLFPWLPRVRDGMVNLGTELMGVAVTVVVIDWFYERRRRKERLGEVIGLIASGSHDFALAGIAEAQHHGWLRDGSMKKAKLSGANLEGAELAGTTLEGANLEGAVNLKQEQIDQASGDEATGLPEGLTRPAHWLKKDEEGD